MAMDKSQIKRTMQAASKKKWQAAASRSNPEKSRQFLDEARTLYTKSLNMAQKIGHTGLQAKARTALEELDRQLRDIARRGQHPGV